MPSAMKSFGHFSMSIGSRHLSKNNSGHLSLSLLSFQLSKTDLARAVLRLVVFGTNGADNWLISSVETEQKCLVTWTTLF